MGRSGGGAVAPWWCAVALVALVALVVVLGALHFGALGDARGLLAARVDTVVLGEFGIRFGSA